MKKKVFTLLLCVLLAFGACAAAAETAAETEWQEIYIPEKQISVCLPGSFEVVTRESEGSAYLSDAQIRVVKATMEQTGSYMDAYTPDFLREITVIVSDSPSLSSLGLLTEENLETFASALKGQYEKDNFRVLGFEFSEDGNARHFKIRLQTEDIAGSYYGLQYGTIVDSQNIIISLLCYDGELTAEDEAMMDRIWQRSDFMKHGPAEEMPGADPLSGQAYYTDPETGFRFAIPEGWQEVPLSKEREYVKTKIAPNGDTKAACIIYSWTDAFARVPEEYKTLLGIRTREDFDLLMDSEEMIAGLAEFNVPSFERKVVNGISCYTGVGRQNYEGILEAETTAIIVVKNGYVYIIQFADLSTDRRYADACETFLNSITIPEN